jgi:hypothetical protein
LIRVGGRWLVADVTDGNWYDGQHKQDRTLNAREELARLKLTVAQNPASGVSGQSPEITPRTDTYGRIPYSAENAIAYAQTYVRNSNSPLTPFYNQSLWSWPEFDCMNFASQCIWAGFSGNQMRAAIDAHDIPMDKGGAAVWYSCSRSKADGARYSTASWRSCSSFRAYIARSNAATDVGMKAKVVNVGDGLPFSGVTETELRGAIAHVDGAAGPLGHAIVITAADGLARNQVYFSSHTRDSENALLWDYYPAGPIRIFVPEYFRTKASIDNALRVTMMRPVGQNSTQVVSCSTNANQHKFTIQITAPSGTTTGSSVYNATSCSHSYQFSEAGTYRVTCYSKTTQSRAAQSVTFYVVSGESRTLVSPAKPPEDTAGMNRKPAPEIRAGGSPILGSRLAHVMKP